MLLSFQPLKPTYNAEIYHLKIIRSSNFDMNQANKLKLVDRADVNCIDTQEMLQEEVVPEQVIARVTPQVVAECMAYSFDIFKF